MTERTCTVSDCDKPHRARGLCCTHYNQEHQPDRHRRIETVCEECATTYVTKRAGGRFCCLACRDVWRRRVALGRPPTRCALPEDHPVLVLISRDRAHVDALREQAMRDRVLAVALLMRPRSCDDCGTVYAPGTTIQRLCSHRCRSRVAKRRRRAREYRATGVHTWTEVMRLFLLFNRCCAYCAQPIEGQPDPDHVVPLSRGGRNSITNILPSCRLCNSDKRDLLLAEWVVDRARRGLAPVATDWDAGDPRTRHLTVTLCA